jgi:hypothetical protein
MTMTSHGENAPDPSEEPLRDQAGEKQPQDSDQEPQSSSKGEGSLRPRHPREYSPWFGGRTRKALFEQTAAGLEQFGVARSQMF